MVNYEIFGKSHDRYIGLRAYNVPVGFVIDYDNINKNMLLRKPGFKFNTSRIEPDEVVFLEGVDNGVITNNPVTFVIENKNIRAHDYSSVIRPSHGDYISYLQYGYIPSGGGAFSGRLTSLLVVLGSIIESNRNYGDINYHISKIQDIKDDDIREKSTIQLSEIDYNFPVFNREIKTKMLSHLEEISTIGESVGGEITFRIDNLKPLIGGSYSNSFESIISKHLYGVGAVKGITFGMGYDYLKYLGSECNDEYYLDNQTIKSSKNLQGGINSGYTNGYEPVIFSVIVRPTPTVFKTAKTISVTGDMYKEVAYCPVGRHDSFIANRVAIVLKMMVLISLLEMELNE